MSRLGSAVADISEKTGTRPVILKAEREIRANARRCHKANRNINKCKERAIPVCTFTEEARSPEKFNCADLIAPSFTKLRYLISYLL